MTELKTKNSKQSSKTVQQLLHQFKPSLPDVKAHIIFWTLAVVGLVFDLWSKKAVFEWLAKKPSNEYTIINGFIKFIVQNNPGAAGGILSGKTLLLISISSIAMTVLLIVFFCSGKQSRFFQITIAILTAGVAGNLYDRIFNDGYVRDFIDVNTHINNYHWPTFNVADSLLCIGVGLIYIWIRITEKPAQKHDQQQK